MLKYNYPVYGVDGIDKSINWLIIVGAIITLVFIGSLYLFWISTSSNSNKTTDKNENETPEEGSDDDYELIPSPTPPTFPETTCIRSNGTETKCGYESRIEPHEVSKELKQKGVISELLLRNNSPVTLDIYHRTPNGTKFIFAGTIPTMQEMYAYKDKEGNNFYRNSELFATRNKETKILYLPVTLTPTETKIVWGMSSSNIDESVVTINLLGEIGHIKFRNYSYANYKLYYYNEYLGELKPYLKDEGTYYEFYVHRGGQGFRIGSKVKILMEGTEQAQEITLDKLHMTTLNVGLALAEKNSE